MIDLVAAAHGTADPRGIREVHSLVRLMASLRPSVPISLGFVDVDVPALPALVDRVVADSNQAVVVPLLLSSGYHTAVDIAREAERRPYQVQAAPALGPDPALADVLVDRLLDCTDLRRVDQVVMAAAGSSDRRALLDCSATAAMLAERIDRPVEVGYVSGAGERLGVGPGSHVLHRPPRRRSHLHARPRLLRRPSTPHRGRPPGQRTSRRRPTSGSPRTPPLRPGPDSHFSGIRSRWLTVVAAAAFCLG